VTRANVEPPIGIEPMTYALRASPVHDGGLWLVSFDAGLCPTLEGCRRPTMGERGHAGGTPSPGPASSRTPRSSRLWPCSRWSGRIWMSRTRQPVRSLLYFAAVLAPNIVAANKRQAAQILEQIEGHHRQ
jgi:hypothetical protein